MFATGKYLKDKAASARRAATTLRQLANESETSIADRGVMLTAAAIVEGIANKTAKLGKERKAAEERYERSIKAAIAEATRLLDGLPATTILDKVATVACIPDRLPYLTEDLDKDNDASRLLRSLDYWAADTRRDLAHDMASSALRAKVAVAEEFAKTQALFNRRLADGTVTRLAERFSYITSHVQEAA